MPRNPPIRRLGCFAVAAALTPVALGASSAPPDLPSVNFGKMGDVGLGGAFAGLDWFSDQSPFAASSSSGSGDSSSRPSFSSNGDTVVVRSENGTFVPLASTNDGGSISALCSFADGSVYIGGSFTSLGSTSASNIISYSPSSSKFSALGDGVTGPVETLYCDDENKQVWAGGLFTAPQSQGNVGVWHTQSATWVPVPFGGLNGRVRTIDPSADGASLNFGGDFSVRYADNSNGTSLARLNSNLASMPFAPRNTRTTGNSGYYAPITLPAATTQYGSISINASPGSSDEARSDPNAVVCPNKGPWVAQDDSQATIDIMGHAHLTAAGVRVANSLIEGRGTKTFSVTALPDNSLLKLQYTDAATGKEATCDSHCPLSTDENVHAQDFLFVEGSQSLTGLHIVLESWQGKGAALGYVQLLSSGAYASAVQDDNTGICGDGHPNLVQAVGNWKSGAAPSKLAGDLQNYVFATVPTDTTTRIAQRDTSLTLYPWVGSSGFYEVSLTIPGCAAIGDCDQRTDVDVAIFPTRDGRPYTISINERVQEDTSVLIYAGHVDASSDQFTPTINVGLSSIPANVNTNNVVVVASGVDMQLTGLSSDTPPVGATSSPGGTASPTAGGQTGSPSGSSSTGSPSEGSTGSPSQGSTGSPSQGSTGSPSQGSTNSPSGTTNSPTSSTPSTTSSSTSAQPSPTVQGVRVAYGVYSWDRSGSGGINASSGLLSNSTENGLTPLGFALDAANNQTSARDFKVMAIAAASNTVFVGGLFKTNSFSNVVQVGSNGSPLPLTAQGLNGAVHAAAAVNNSVFFGGEFTKTASGDDELNHIAQYDPSSKKWTAVGGGVDGPVANIISYKDSVLVVGNFTNVQFANGTTASTGGIALYNTSTSEWATGGILYGAIAAAVESGNESFLGGRILGMSQNPVNGVASLKSNNDGTASVSSLEGVSFSNTGSAPAPAQSNVKRSQVGRWLTRIHATLDRRHVVPRADEPQISDVPVDAPASVAGAYWKNSSASDTRVTVLGGNFTHGSGDNLISGVAFYSDSKLTGPSPPVSGIVRALEVHGDELFVGGSGVNVSGVGEGLLKYKLKDGAWATGSELLPGLEPTGFNVNSIKARTDTDTVAVAGNFAQAGQLPCPAVCLWDTKKNQWNQPGVSGISSGEVKSIAYGGDKLGTLVAGGSFTLDDKAVYAAAYHFDNQSWTALGDLPGPVLSIAVNDRNLNSIFATGYDAQSSKPYLKQWDGSSWTEQNSEALLPGTAIQNLAFVPLHQKHDAAGSIQEDRMLMASGDVLLSGRGNVSSALYDGKAWHPYLVGSTATGALGAASSMWWSEPGFSFSLRKYLDRGIVVLVAMAIATGLILLIVLVILLVAYCYRRSERKHQTRDMYDKDGGASEMSSTHNLIHDHVQSALHQSFQPVGHHHHAGPSHGGMMGAGAAGLGAGAAAGAYAHHHHHGGSDDSHYHDSMAWGEPVDINAEPMVGGGMAGSYEGDGSGSGSDEGRETMMRYDFAGPELQAGELSMRAGQRVVILDDEQSDEWWYARDPATGRQGVVPATYGK